MNILYRAGLGHIADRLSPVADIPPPDDHFDRMAMRREQAQHYLATHRCASRFGEATVDYPRAEAWVRRVLSDDRGVAPTLLLIGPTGAGKTRLGWAVLRALKLGRAEQGRGLDCWLVGHADFNAQCRPTPDDAHLGAFERYANSELLVLDDLAATRATDWTEENLYRLVDARWVTKRPTVIATNFSTRRTEEPNGKPSRSDLERAVGDRVASRVMDAVFVAVTGSDRRLVDARQRMAAESS